MVHGGTRNSDGPPSGFRCLQGLLHLDMSPHLRSPVEQTLCFGRQLRAGIGTDTSKL